MDDNTSHEKPYDFVPLPVGEVRTQAAGHHTAIGTRLSPRLSGILTGAIVSESLVQVASGFVVTVEDILRYQDIDQQSIGDEQLIAAHMRTNNKRVIPGSTLKGAIRSAVEAITSPGTRFDIEPRTKTIRRGGRSFQVRELRNRPRPQQLTPPPEIPTLSLANLLFGLTSGRHGYQGHCTFYDASQRSGIGVLFRRLPLYRPQPDYSEGDPALETGWQRYFLDVRRTHVRGRKFYRAGISREVEEPYTAVEGCSIGSEFTFEMHFHNLLASELGVILIVLGADNDIPRLKIGSGKPVSMGAVRFRDLEIQVVSPASYKSFDTELVLYPIADCVKAANDAQAFFKAGREKLAEIMTRPASFTAGGDERIY